MDGPGRGGLPHVRVEPQRNLPASCNWRHSRREERPSHAHLDGQPAELPRVLTCCDIRKSDKTLNGNRSSVSTSETVGSGNRVAHQDLLSAAQQRLPPPVYVLPRAPRWRRSSLRAAVQGNCMLPATAKIARRNARRDLEACPMTDKQIGTGQGLDADA